MLTIGARRHGRVQDRRRQTCGRTADLGDALATLADDAEEFDAAAFGVFTDRGARVCRLL